MEIKPYLSVSSVNFGLLEGFHCDAAAAMVYFWNSRLSMHLTASRAEDYNVKMFMAVFR